MGGVGRPRRPTVAGRFAARDGPSYFCAEGSWQGGGRRTRRVSGRDRGGVWPGARRTPVQTGNAHGQFSATRP